MRAPAPKRSFTVSAAATIRFTTSTAPTTSFQSAAQLHSRPTSSATTFSSNSTTKLSRLPTSSPQQIRRRLTFKATSIPITPTKRAARLSAVHRSRSRPLPPLTPSLPMTRKTISLSTTTKAPRQSPASTSKTSRLPTTATAKSRSDLRTTRTSSLKTSRPVRSSSARIPLTFTKIISRRAQVTRSLPTMLTSRRRAPVQILTDLMSPTAP